MIEGLRLLSVCGEPIKEHAAVVFWQVAAGPDCSIFKNGLAVRRGEVPVGLLWPFSCQRYRRA